MCGLFVCCSFGLFSWIYSQNNTTGFSLCSESIAGFQQKSTYFHTELSKHLRKGKIKALPYCTTTKWQGGDGKKVRTRKESSKQQSSKINYRLCTASSFFRPYCYHVVKLHHNVCLAQTSALSLAFAFALTPKTKCICNFVCTHTFLDAPISFIVFAVSLSLCVHLFPSFDTMFVLFFADSRAYDMQLCIL